MKRTFRISAVWDEEAKVFYSESDIIGLHIEAATLDEFIAVMNECAPGLIIDNHILKPDLVSRPLRDLIPAIMFCAPNSSHSMA